MRRQAPDPEWVLMYRQGTSTARIATLAGAAETTVRYHLQIAARAEPSIRDEHAAAAAPPPKRLDERTLKNLEDVLALYREEGRLPSSKSTSRRERTLNSWFHRQRQESWNGTISPACRDGLAVIPGWDAPPRQKEEREALWNGRLAELTAYRKVGHDWPLHKKAGSEEERLLGVWLHSQRINYRNGSLRPDRESRLDTELPGWREGRPRRGGRPTPTPSGGDGVPA